jgi:hypothetical protein
MLQNYTVYCSFLRFGSPVQYNNIHNKSKKSYELPLDNSHKNCIWIYCNIEKLCNIKNQNNLVKTYSLMTLSGLSFADLKGHTQLYSISPDISVHNNKPVPMKY